jgi:hypothetical protein
VDLGQQLDDLGRPGIVGCVGGGIGVELADER